MPERRAGQGGECRQGSASGRIVGEVLAHLGPFDDDTPGTRQPVAHVGQRAARHEKAALFEQLEFPAADFSDRQHAKR